MTAFTFCIGFRRIVRGHASCGGGVRFAHEAERPTSAPTVENPAARLLEVRGNQGICRAVEHLPSAPPQVLVSVSAGSYAT